MDDHDTIKERHNLLILGEIKKWGEGYYYMTYDAYLQSSEWRELKEAVLTRDKSTCRKCGSNEHLEVHHLIYPSDRVFIEGKWFSNWLTDETRFCVTLCAGCHSEVHGFPPRQRGEPQYIYTLGIDTDKDDDPKEIAFDEHDMPIWPPR